jgi:hypothetical protein
MGIKNLNRFLVDNCKKSSICKKTFDVLRNKTIVIDTSIYLYKYNAQDALLENFYLMISLFHKYNITPLFIFDGKPPPEKRELLRRRKLLKQEAEERFMLLKDQMADENDAELRKSLNMEMDNLKRQFIRVSPRDTKMVKELITAYGAMYYDADGEADRVCAYMVISGRAWACLSDDMDMFVYGCERVLRHMSLLNESVLLYKTPSMLIDLRMNMSVFRQIAVLSGTDYNIDNETTLVESMKWYEQCMRADGFTLDTLNGPYGFYDWLRANTKYIKNMEDLTGIYDMFNMEGVSYPELDQLNISLNPNYNADQLQSILKEDGFVFT